MFKKLKNWHLSVLVGLASLLSLIFIQHYVLAQWTEPIEVPGGSRVTHLVVNPMTENLNLGSGLNDAYYGIFGGTAANNVSISPKNTGIDTGIIYAKGGTWAGYFDGDVIIKGDLTVDGNYPGGGGGTGESLWIKLADPDNRIYYNAGYVGIGNSNPIHSLDIVQSVDGSDNPEISLNAFGTSGAQWGIYHDRKWGTDQLRFWHDGSNRVVINPEGKVGIGTDNPNASLTVNGAISRQGTTLRGAYPSNIVTQVNLGVDSETGNTLGGGYATVSGGGDNHATGNSSTVAGGYVNTATNLYATVSGGGDNHATGEKSTVTGGFQNIASGLASVVSGRENTASGDKSTVTGGFQNTASGLGSIAGGFVNVASGNYSIALGGDHNQALGANSTIGGGNTNKVTSGVFSTIGGGKANEIIGSYAVIAGGIANLAYSSATIGGGDENRAKEGYSTISGGWRNTINPGGTLATISGGQENVASGNMSTVAGGYDNKANGDASTVSGGQHNTATGWSSMVSGGFHSDALGNYSWAGGTYAKANNKGSFVWADNSAEVAYNSNADNTFNIRAIGGVYLGGSLKWDVAEFMDILKSDNIQAAEIVALKEDNKLGKTIGAYDPNLIGVISSERTTSLHLGSTEASYNDTVKMPVALVGQVFVKVNNQNGAIKIGDPITSSNVPGVGMKATQMGKIIGYAMETENFQAGDTQEILVFANVGYYLPTDKAEEISRLNILEKEVQVLKQQMLWKNIFSK